MDKIVEKLLIEFLVPSFLMLLCLVLTADLVLAKDFDLRSHIHQLTLGSSMLVLGLILLSYLINTSLSSFMNLIFRRALWGETRVYLIYRRLHIFREDELRHVNWGKYLYWRFLRKEKYRDLQEKIKTAKKKGAVNLYQVFVAKLIAVGVPDRLTKDTLYLYETLRTIVLASGDNAIISWIQYHWSHLRLARSTLFPAFLLIILFPLVMHYEWSQPILHAIIAAIFCLAFFLIEFVHYYYREKFMIYAMISYFLTFRSDKMKGSNECGHGIKDVKQHSERNVDNRNEKETELQERT